MAKAMAKPLPQLDLKTGTWGNDLLFHEHPVHVGEEFHIAGCGFDVVVGNGDSVESRFTGAADPNRTYSYDIGPDGCIVPGGSSTYMAPPQAGFYWITYFWWAGSDATETPLGRFRVRVLK